MGLPELQDNIGSPTGAEATESLGPMLEGLGGGTTEFVLALPELQDNIGSPTGAEATESLGPMLEGEGADHRVCFGIT